jgi:hypothetical protein
MEFRVYPNDAIGINILFGEEAPSFWGRRSKRVESARLVLRRSE